MTGVSDGRDFGARIIDWWHRAGRKDLPWQQHRSPYRVWVSEIMLQQTQVSTALDYFTAFTVRWPDVAALAAASLDDVLHAWSGLGYYSRARNLHRAAGAIVADHDGVLPDSLEALMALPGIGRSTAGAILALGHGRRGVILDGNVKRVLARHLGEPEWPGKPAVEHRLWATAEARTPATGFDIYTQAIMDLGATVCSRRRPRCSDCPVADDCRARRLGQQDALPAARPRKAIPERRVLLWLLSCGDALWLERRPESGLWGGLWSLPEAPLPVADADAADLMVHFRSTGPAGWRELPVQSPERLPELRHAFTHFRLRMTPVRISLTAPATARVGEQASAGLWYNGTGNLGLPAPIRRLLHAQPHLKTVSNATGTTTLPLALSLPDGSSSR